MDKGVLEIMDSLPCNVHTAFLDPTGEFLYQGHWDGIDVYAISETGLTAVQSVAIEGLKHAVGSRAGAAVYAADDNSSLWVFTRDQNTGRLTAAGEVDLADRAVTIAISDDDAYLVALAPDGTTDAWELTARSAIPRGINILGPVGNRTWRDPVDGDCDFIAARGGSAAFDAFCRNSAFSVAIRAGDADAAPMLEATDYVANWQADRFNNYIPEFKSQALAVSPDGRHAYVYSEGDILIFERIGNQPPAEQ